MKTCLAGSIVVVFIFGFGSPPALAQTAPDFQRTKVVDPNADPDANFAEIQDAIDAITVGAGQHWTVLIYPGVYIIDGSTAALIHLDGGDERISLRGVDRQSVIIDVTTAGSGIKITSGTETLRECRISNLTIKTSNGHGIEIVKGGGGSDQTPKDIRIEGVTIEAAGTDKNGIVASGIQDCRIADCEIATMQGNAIDIGKASARAEAAKHIVLGNLTLRPEGSGDAIRIGCPVEDVLIQSLDIRLKSKSRALHFLPSADGSRNVRAFGMLVEGPMESEAIVKPPGVDVRLLYCDLPQAVSPSAQASP